MKSYIYLLVALFLVSGVSASSLTVIQGTASQGTVTVNCFHGNNSVMPAIKQTNTTQLGTYTVVFPSIVCSPNDLVIVQKGSIYSYGFVKFYGTINYVKIDIN